MQQQNRILLLRDGCIGGPNPPKGDIGVVGSLEFIVIDSVTIEMDQLLCIRESVTDGQEHMLVGVLVRTYHSF